MNLIDLIDHSTGPIEVGFGDPGLSFEPGVCNDDPEYTAALMLPLPEESDHEHGSPLNFGRDGG